ncbi:MAG: ABC transporter ATP-binding protein [Bacteroidota bacterium]
MKTFQRILKYAPIQRFILPFFTYSIISSLFGILTFTLIQTLLDVLFGKNEVNVSVPPILKWNNLESMVDYFNYSINKFTSEKGKVKTLWLVCGIIIFSVLISNIFRYLSSRIIESVKGFTVLSLRKTVFEKALKLNLSFFNDKRKGDIISRLTTDIQEVENSIGKAFSAIFKDVVLLIIFFIVLFWRSWELTIFSLLIIPISGFVIGSLTKKLKESATDVQQNQSNLISLFDEVFGGIRVIKGFGAEKYIIEKFRNENEGYFKSWLKMLFRQEAAPPVSEILGVTLVATILLYGGTLVLSGDSNMTASAFVAYILLYSQVTRPAKEISNAIAGTQRGIVAADRILSLIDTESTIKEIENPVEISEIKDKIEFKNVHFRYNNSKEVLKNINFTIPKGKTVALVGSSGSGKSTIADLLPRFYEVTSGEILVDGIPIQNIKIESLRKIMGIVTQESILFNDSIKNNILFGSKFSEKEVEEASKIANAHQFIIQTKAGYETFIGDRGGKLSGGQRQRLSIARAILKNPPLLVLDEATSALDTESEKLVQESLAKLMKNRTTLVIAHRLSTIQNADEIIVIHKGEIVEKGTHNQLITIENGFYKKLNSMQEASN